MIKLPSTYPVEFVLYLLKKINFNVPDEILLVDEPLMIIHFASVSSAKNG